MSNKNDDFFDGWAGIFLGVLAILAIKSIFEDDNSKIISKQGRNFLLDDEKMKDINAEILKSENNSGHNEIYI